MASPDSVSQEPTTATRAPELPLNALRTFEAFSRTRSLKGAAQWLGVTPGAVCRQLERLSSAGGSPLLVKVQGRLVLTTIGHRLAEKLRQAFTEIESAQAEFLGADPLGGRAGGESGDNRRTPTDEVTTFHANRNLHATRHTREPAVV